MNGLVDGLVNGLVDGLVRRLVEGLVNWFPVSRHFLCVMLRSVMLGSVILRSVVLRSEILRSILLRCVPFRCLMFRSLVLRSVILRSKMLRYKLVRCEMLWSIHSIILGVVLADHLWFMHIVVLWFKRDTHWHRHSDVVLRSHLKHLLIIVRNYLAFIERHTGSCLFLGHLWLTTFLVFLSKSLVAV